MSTTSHKRPTMDHASTQAAGMHAAATAATRPMLAYWLSGLLTAATLTGTAAAYFVPDLFQRDNPALAGCARGTALVMLAVAVPAMLISMLLAARGSQRARLVWLGMAGYIFYNSIYFTFGSTFNRFFLVFLAMLSLSGWVLLVLLKETSAGDVKAAFGPKTPARFASAALLFPVLIFIITDLKESLVATFTNTLPPSIVDTQLTVSPFVVMDLALLVPLFILAAAWLWMRKPWGFLLAGMLLSFYTIELFGIGVDQWYGGNAAPGSPLASASAAPAFFVLGTVFLIILSVFFRKIPDQGETAK